jgi:hypothetical protein
MYAYAVADDLPTIDLIFKVNYNYLIKLNFAQPELNQLRIRKDEID